MGKKIEKPSIFNYLGIIDKIQAQKSDNFSGKSQYCILLKRLRKLN